MKHLIPAIFLMMAFVIAPSFVKSPAFISGAAFAAEQKYTCPMHPHYVADRPGSCPICGMDLVALESDGEEDGVIEEDVTQVAPSPSGKTGEKKILYWVAPMNPNYKMDKPGKSPMGMDLVPVYAEEEDTNTNTAKKNSNKRSGVTIAPETIQSMGVRTEKAQMVSFGTLVRSYGDVTENVRLQSDISGRVSGWIKNLRIKAEGDEVKKGDLLFKLDSPELISAQQDYISARSTGIKGRINAAKRRLGSLGMQGMAIKEIKGKAKPYIPFYATQDGIVSEINIREGSYVKPGMKVIQIQDYSSVWIDVSIAEQDIPYVNAETKVSVAFPNLGIQAQDAKIDYIYPTIDRATRTGRVRLVLDNADKMIKPGAYADVEFETGVKRRLSIPSDAILKSKDGDFVVVAIREGRFQPRKILSGLRYKGRTEVLDGLKNNDNVVVSGQFLIDSESALRESFRKMKRMQTGLAALDIDDDQMAMIDHLVDAALYIHAEVTAGRSPNSKMIMPALTLGDHLIPVFRGTQLQFVLEDAERALIKGKESLTDKEWLETMNELVIALKPWILEGKPDHYTSKNVRIYMDHALNTYWLQRGDAPQNPYGSGMAMRMSDMAGEETDAK
ncbi:MAG: efflux RND transporter periplasmic adaptor subunit [Planctomycetaceae bacterium]|nr:efflux RND transporter periplasmic adaptor subunit [Planctomycetaceae bacterium]